MTPLHYAICSQPIAYSNKKGKLLWLHMTPSDNTVNRKVEIKEKGQEKQKKRILWLHMTPSGNAIIDLIENWKKRKNKENEKWQCMTPSDNAIIEYW